MGDKVISTQDFLGIGDYDLWSLYLMDKGGKVRCTSLRTFAYYVCSPRTVALMIDKHNASRGVVEMRAIGPECWEDGYLYVFYRVIGKECREFLSVDEQWRFGDALSLMADQNSANPELKSPRGGAAARRILGLPLPKEEMVSMRAGTKWRKAARKKAS